MSPICSLFEGRLLETRAAASEEPVVYHVKDVDQEVFHDIYRDELDVKDLGEQLLELRAQLKVTLGELRARRDAAKTALGSLLWPDVIRVDDYSLH